MIALLFVLLACCIFFSIPIAFSMALTSLIGLVSLEIPLKTAITQAFQGVDSFTLMAVPFFILAGNIMGKGGIIGQIINFSNALVGNVRGGLAHVNIVSSMIFSGVSGSGVADSSAIGSMLIPSMVKQGYDKDFSVVVTCTSSTIGPIIPPSIPFVLYGIYTRQSIGRLFLGGVIPGLMIGLGLMLMVHLVCLKRQYDFRQGRASIQKIIAAFFNSIGALIMPFIIIFGIISGVFTATEAGAVAVVYGLLFGLFVTRDLTLKDLPKILIDSAVMTATVMLIVSMATILSNILARLSFQDMMINSILSITDSPILSALLVMVLLLFLGLFIDATVVLIMFAPILSRLGQQLGFDPIHFGVLMVIVMLIGSITPPVGSMLFVACSIANISIEETFKILLPFFFVLVGVALITLFFPPVATFIPNLF